MKKVVLETLLMKFFASETARRASPQAAASPPAAGCLQHKVKHHQPLLVKGLRSPAAGSQARLAHPCGRLHTVKSCTMHGRSLSAPSEHVVQRDLALHLHECPISAGTLPSHQGATATSTQPSLPGARHFQSPGGYALAEQSHKT